MAGSKDGENGEWCAPTRELESSTLLELVHRTRAAPVDVREPIETLASAPRPELARGSRISYPVYRDRLRPLRLALIIAVPLTALAVAVFVLLAR